jgi:biopolymer transport protein ExbB/TolQ
MKRPLLISGIVVGTLLASAPVWGLLATVFSMNQAFKVLGSAGVANPQGLSTTIGGALYSSMLSVIACPIGIVLLILCIVLLATSRKPVPPPPLPPAA